MTTIDWLESLVLGAIQGLTEFLPISSDGHLALGQALFETIRGERRSGSDKLLLDIILHLGTLVAVLIYYRDWFRPLLRRQSETSQPQITTGPIPPELVPQSRHEFFHLFFLAIVATIPTGIFGLAMKKLFEAAHDSLTAAALGFWVTALILWVSQKFTGGTKSRLTMTWKDAFLIGLAQAFAPLPGVSRSGLTVTAALACGLSRQWAAFFSLWMSIPAISGALIMEIKDLIQAPSFDGRLIVMGLIGSVVSGLVGYGAIIWLVRIVKSRRLDLFTWYLVALGAVVLVWSLKTG